MPLTLVRYLASHVSYYTAICEHGTCSLVGSLYANFPSHVRDLLRLKLDLLRYSFVSVPTDVCACDIFALLIHHNIVVDNLIIPLFLLLLCREMIFRSYGRKFGVNLNLLPPGSSDSRCTRGRRSMKTILIGNS
jgi:hypothetical protein